MIYDITLSIDYTYAAPSDRLRNLLRLLPGDLPGVQRVIVNARVSKTGQAIPAPGDLTGQTAAVEVGTSGLMIEINEAVQ
mgnify:CR=1 FL=1